MEIKKYEIGNVNYEFVCEGWSNSRGWGHEVHLFRDGWEIAENRIRYYNRTWENYRFQSCMLGAIDSAMTDIVERAIENYKYKNNVERFKKGEKQTVIENVEKENEDYKSLVELRDKVRGNVW